MNDKELEEIENLDNEPIEEGNPFFNKNSSFYNKSYSSFPKKDYSSQNNNFGNKNNKDNKNSSLEQKSSLNKKNFYNPLKKNKDVNSLNKNSNKSIFNSRKGKNENLGVDDNNKTGGNVLTSLGGKLGNSVNAGVRAAWKKIPFSVKVYIFLGIGLLFLVIFLILIVGAFFAGESGDDYSYSYSAASTSDLDFMCNMSDPFGTSSYSVTSFYGWRVHPIYNDNRFHYGIDLVGDKNAKIYAVADGIITYIGDNPNDSLGINITISHDAGYSTQYGHMSSRIKELKVGDKIREGEQIGVQGTTGDSTGEHLHFIIYKDGKNISPNPYFNISDEGYEECVSPSSSTKYLTSRCNTSSSYEARNMSSNGFVNVCSSKKYNYSSSSSSAEHELVVKIARRELEIWNKDPSYAIRVDKIKSYLRGCGLDSEFLYDYCAGFTSYVLKEANVFDKIGLPSYSCFANFPIQTEGGTGVFHYNSKEDYVPQPGDLIVYLWSGDTGEASHVGIVEYVEDGIVHTIEGNISPMSSYYPGYNYTSKHLGVVATRGFRKIDDSQIVGYLSW